MGNGLSLVIGAAILIACNYVYGEYEAKWLAIGLMIAFAASAFEDKKA